MKAIISNKYGAPKNLKINLVKKPKPNDSEILIKVFNTTVNRTDCAILRGKPLIMRFVNGFLKPKKTIMGTDFAGQIVSVGVNVTKFKINDRVWGFNDKGLSSQCEYTTINHNEAVSKIPVEFDYKEIICCAEGCHYALNFINKIELNPNSQVIINGATGAIGSSLLQILKYYDVKVTAVCNTDNIEFVKSLGADEIIDYNQEDFTEKETKYDFVLDAVGKSRFSKCKNILKPKGVYISSELGNNLENIWLSIYTKFVGQKKVIIPIPFNCKRTLEFMNEIVTKDKFTPVIDRIYTLDKIVEAYQYVEKGTKLGNVIVKY